MKTSEMTPEQLEEKRRYDREAKQRSRAAQKSARYIPTAEDAISSFAAEHLDRVKELDKYVAQFTKTVEQEISRSLGSPQKDSQGHVTGWDGDEEWTLDRIGRSLYAFKKGWTQKVSEGEITGGLYFADCFGTVVESAHRHNLKNSPAFAATYRELLELLDKRYGRQATEDAAIIRAELAGTYKPSEPPKPKEPEPLAPEPEPILSTAEILAKSRADLLSRIGNEWVPPHVRVPDPSVAPEAQRFLVGR